MFNPSRLSLARQRKGMTLKSLSNESGVSVRSISSFENGKSEPSGETLRKIAQALSVPPTFFTRESLEPMALEAVSFRKLSKTSATKRDAVLANANLAMEFFALIEDKFKLPVADIPSLDKFRPEQAAEVLRHRWALGDRPISNMVHLLESKGVRIAAIDHAYADIDAFCFVRDSVPFIFLHTSKTGERQRFDAAHELGHLVLHSEHEMAPSESKVREAEANQFAAAFLMPRSAILSQSMSNASQERILAARSFWKVSAMAMTHRLHELELLTDWQYRSMAMELSQRGYRSTEPGGITPETSQLLRKVMFGSANKIRPAEAAKALDLTRSDIRNFVRNLVPIVAV